MFKNIVKVAWRNLIHNKAGSLVNIGGLALGMAAAMLIGLWILGEFSFDKYHSSYDRIAAVMQNHHQNGEVYTAPGLPGALEQTLKNDFGGSFKYVVKSSFSWDHVIVRNETNLLETGCFMDPEAGEMLGLDMLQGSRSGLRDPASILISESVMKGFFGNDHNVIGQVIRLDDQAVVRISGVYRDLPRNSSFHDLAFIAPWEQYYRFDSAVKRASTNWENNFFRIYVQLADQADIKKTSASIRDLIQQRAGNGVALLKPVIFLHPMKDWHLYAEFENGGPIGDGIRSVWLFGLTGLLILLLACINFINISTAGAEKRAKEIGLRKTVGSLRSQLVIQFFCESFLIVLIAFVLSLILVEIVLPWFNLVAGRDLHVSWSNPMIWIGSLIFCLFTGLLAGSYPAIYLSSIKAVSVLKGPFRAGPRATIRRKSLVVVQFAISIILIIGTVTVYRQIQFAQNRPVGYDRERLVAVEMLTRAMHNQFAALRNDLIGSGTVAEVAEASDPTTEIYHSSGGFSWRGKNPAEPGVFPSVGVTPEYGKTVGWQFLDGRDFSTAHIADSQAVVLNEAAVKYMGLKNPVGETIRWSRDYRVIGVIRNMLMESPYQPVRPTIFYINPGVGGYLSIRLAAGVHPHDALRQIEAVCKKYAPAEPFSYRFVDEAYAKKFENEERTASLAGAFCLIAICISCTGLFGMASFMSSQRSLEIGMRKVLGASVVNVWILLIRDFMQMIGIALMIAIPLSYYLTQNWLGHYQYHPEPSWTVFILTAIGSMTVTLLTVSYQTIQAALTNPLNSIKTA